MQLTKHTFEIGIFFRVLAHYEPVLFSKTENHSNCCCMETLLPEAKIAWNPVDKREI